MLVEVPARPCGDRGPDRVIVGAGHDLQPDLEVVQRAMDDLDATASVLTRLRLKGFSVALDDFGAGASSFGYLRQMTVDYIKIDGQFISHVADDPVDRSMVEAICKVGRALGIETVAECVESQAMLDELSRIGIDYAQGYYLARPEPIERLVL